jgi:hypothetical protein
MCTGNSFLVKKRNADLILCLYAEELSTTELAEELVEKLEFFKINKEKISNLKLTAVKIEVINPGTFPLTTPPPPPSCYPGT